MTRRFLTISAILLAACGPDSPADRPADAPGDSVASADTTVAGGSTYSPPPVGCTDELVASIELAIVDAETQEPVRGPTAWVSDGTRVDTLASSDGFAAAMWERAGTYEVHVEHPSYAMWTDPSVVVTEGECHVTTQKRRVLLQPLR
jgi:hypothetical protein